MKKIMMLSIAILFSCCASSYKPTWHDKVLHVSGMGLYPNTGTAAQKQLMSKRASRVNAIYVLASHIKNLPVDNESKVADYLESNWTPVGFVIKSVKYQTDGCCTTTLSMPLRKVWESISQAYQNRH